MSGYLFDTNIVRNWYAGRPSVVTRVQALQGTSPLYISSVTLGEIEYGHTSPASDMQSQAAFRKWIRETFELPELFITASTAIEYAKFRRRLFTRFTRKGKYPENCEDQLGAKIGVDENDLWLVAQACERNLTFITHDRMEKIMVILDDEVYVDLWPDI